MKSLLFIAPNWVGDSIFMLPACAALRRVSSDARITLLARPAIAALHGANPLFDERVPLPQGGRMARFAAHWGLREREFDAAVVFPPSFSSALAALLSGASARYGRRGEGRAFLLTSTLPRAPRTGHVADEYAELARLAGAEPEPSDKLLHLPLTQEGAEEQSRMFREAGIPSDARAVALCPTSAYGPSKRWGGARYAGLARRFKDERYQPFLLGAQHELPELRAIAAEAGGVPVLTPSLPGLAACLAASALAFANDSGPLHIAAAVGTRCVGFYGPVSPHWSSPLSHRATVLYTSEDCSPCHARVCPLAHHACMEKISVEQAMNAGLELLRR